MYSPDPRYDDRTPTCAEDGCRQPVCASSRELCSHHEIRAAIDSGQYVRAYDVAADNGISSTYVAAVIAESYRYTARVASIRLAVDAIVADLARVA